VGGLKVGRGGDRIGGMIILYLSTLSSKKMRTTPSGTLCGLGGTANPAFQVRVVLFRTFGQAHN
jgi:hypothetical protein